jgi:hypothetical protein
MGDRDRTRRGRVASLTVAVALAAFAVTTGSGCEVIVGDTVPSTIACAGDFADECPEGQACAAQVCTPCDTLGLTAECTPLPFDAGYDGGHDAVARVDAPRSVDAPREVTVAEEAAPAPEAATSGAVGDPCTESSSCTTGLVCVPVADLSNLTLTAASVCSQSCCTNTDCGGDLVCYPTAGGGLCISAADAAGCGGSCGTSCCTDSDCTGSDYCAYATTHAGDFVPSCQPFGSDSQCQGVPDCSGNADDPCLTDSDCKSAVCVPDENKTCAESFACECWSTGSCCNNDPCDDGMTCQWAVTYDAANDDVLVRACDTSGGSTETGDACTNGASGANDCSGGICASFAGQTGDLCTQACCEDSDCTKIGTGWICAPYSQQLGVGAVVLLVCQPTRP